MSLREIRVIVSMVERVSKLTKVVKISRKTADEVAQAIIDQPKPCKAFVHTLTSDNGKKFAFHQKIVGYALKDANKPINVASYHLVKKTSQRT